jgi:hypothetical protein
MERAERLEAIPKITHRWGKVWKQPDRKFIEVGEAIARMSQHTFDELAEYSCSIPSGVYEGKMWKRHDGAHDPRCKPEDRKWMLMWFGPSADPDKCSINHRLIEILGTANETDESLSTSPEAK